MRKPTQKEKMTREIRFVVRPRFHNAFQKFCEETETTVSARLRSLMMGDVHTYFRLHALKD